MEATVGAAAWKSDVSRRRLIVADIAGFLIAIATLAWVSVIAEFPPTVLILCASIFVLGRLAASVHRALPPAALAITGALLALFNEITNAAPLSGPFGYSNATAAFYLLVGLAALMIAVVTPSRAARVLVVAGAIAAAGIPFFAQSMAASILVVVGGVVAIAAVSVRTARSAIFGLLGLFVAVLLGTIVIGARHDSGGFMPAWVADPLTERRITIWGDAVRTTRENPAAGVGFGRFPLFSPAASSDSSSSWAHNEFLQFGAEGGVPALALLAGIFVWGLIRLGLMRGPDRYAVLGAGALAFTGVHASVDGVLRFWPIPLAAALLAGAATFEARR